MLFRSIGFEVLTQAGFDSSGMARMFELLQAEARTNGGNAPEFLLTHPLTQSRIAFAKEREQQNDQQSFYSSLGFQLIRVRALLYQTRKEARPAALQALLANAPKSLKEPVQFYADILSAIDSGQPEKALTLIEEKLALQPDHLYFRLLNAKVLAANGRFDEALERLQRQIKETPDSLPVKALIAQIHLNAGHSGQALAAFKALSKERFEDPWAWQQLAKAATQAKDLLTVYKANAEYHQLTGDIPHGVAELKLAREYASNDPIEYARIDHRITELQTLFKQLDFK